MKPKSYRKKSTRTLRAPAASAAGVPFASPDPQAASVVEALRNELPQLLAAAVVQVASGQCTATYASPAASGNLTAAAAHNAEVIRQVQALAASHLPSEILEDVLISLSAQLHVLRLTPTGRQFVYAAVPAQGASLGLVREVVRVQATNLLA